MKNSEACTRDVVTVTRESPLCEAASLMRERHIGSVVVIDDKASGHPVGILTDRDMVVEVLASGIEPRTVTVGDIMSTPVFTAGENEDVLRTLKAMRIRGVRRVPIVDDGGRLSGIASLDDMLAVAGDALFDVVGAIGSERAMESWRRR